MLAPGKPWGLGVSVRLAVVAADARFLAAVADAVGVRWVAIGFVPRLVARQPLVSVRGAVLVGFGGAVFVLALHIRALGEPAP